MRLGVHLVSFDFEGGAPAIAPTVAAFGAAVEDAGVENVSVMDHYFQMEMMGSAGLNMLEAYTTLGFLAAHTSSVELQALVTGVTYRHPGLLAKIVATLDVLSGGRTALGIGAAWYEREHLGLGVPFPPVAERFERLEETLLIVRQMWGPDNGAFEGRYYRLAETLCVPAPVRTPPVMVGGQGERKSLRLAAKYGDACNLFADPESGPAAIEHKLLVLREHCEREGTDYDAIRKTILWAASLDPASDGPAFVEQMKGFADVGVDEVHVMHMGNQPVSFVQGLGRSVVPALNHV
jgi:F420-dependent oxidoreductase-like protein